MVRLGDILILQFSFKDVAFSFEIYVVCNSNSLILFIDTVKRSLELQAAVSDFFTQKVVDLGSKNQFFAFSERLGL